MISSKSQPRHDQSGACLWDYDFSFSAFFRLVSSAVKILLFALAYGFPVSCRIKSTSAFLYGVPSGRSTS